MKMIILISLLMSFTASAYFCPTTIIRPGNIEKSRCTVYVKYSDGSYYGWESFYAQVGSKGCYEAQKNCIDAEHEAMAKCLDYKKYEGQGRGSCKVTSHQCRNYKID